MVGLGSHPPVLEVGLGDFSLYLPKQSVWPLFLVGELASYTAITAFS